MPSSAQRRWRGQNRSRRMTCVSSWGSAADMNSTWSPISRCGGWRPAFFDVYKRRPDGVLTARPNGRRINSASLRKDKPGNGGAHRTAAMLPTILKQRVRAAFPLALARSFAGVRSSRSKFENFRSPAHTTGPSNGRERRADGRLACTRPIRPGPSSAAVRLQRGRRPEELEKETSAE